MRVVISCNNEPMYLFCLPIVVYGWNKIGVFADIIIPKCENTPSYEFVMDEVDKLGILNKIIYFNSPSKNQEVTYTQCSRLFSAPYADNQKEVLICSDVDMLVFKRPPTPIADEFVVYGHDLVPEGQYPMCYISAKYKTWREAFCGSDDIDENLHNLLGDIKVDNMRGNYWSKDQETAFNAISKTDVSLVPRARNGTTFADKRCDRDDAFWFDRLGDGFMDAHLWRPLYTEKNIGNLCRLWSMMYPDESTKWLNDYAKKFRELL